MTNTGLPFKEIELDASKIVDWPSFHTIFAATFGFPDFYGRNMDAWIDCMTDLDEPEAGMSKVHAPPNGVLLLKVLNVRAFAQRCPDQFGVLRDCAAFVNWRRREVGQPPVIVLSYHD